jgi:hypothetical protein
MIKIIKAKRYSVDLIIFLLLIGLYILGSINGTMQYYGTLFFIILGLSFIVSKKTKDELVLSKILYWVSRYILKPTTKYNHIFGGCLSIFAGFAIFFSGPTNPDELILWECQKHTISFWVSIIIVLIFNIIIGIYSNKKNVKH